VLLQEASARHCGCLGSLRACRGATCETKFDRAGCQGAHRRHRRRWDADAARSRPPVQRRALECAGGDAIGRAASAASRRCARARRAALPRRQRGLFSRSCAMAAPRTRAAASQARAAWHRGPQRQLRVARRARRGPGARTLC
jgi:hypothetical protein